MYLTNCRHRFLMVFIQFVLHLGPDSPSNVLNNMVYKLAGASPYAGLNLIPEMDLRSLIPSSEAMQSAILLNPSTRSRRSIPARAEPNTGLMTSILQIVSTWLLNGRKPNLDDSEIALVTYGFGQLVSDAGKSPKGNFVASENLVAASLAAWLDDKGQSHSLQDYLNRELATESHVKRGLAFEDVFVYELWKTFSTGATLDTIFDFCYLPPSWKSEKAQLISVFKVYHDKEAPHLVPMRLTTRLAWSTGNQAQSMNWLEHGKAACLRVPFLKPDNNFGPDIMFGLRLKSGDEVFVCVQCKCWSTKHGVSDIEKAVFKLSPEGFYSGNNVSVSRNALRTAEDSLQLSDATKALTVPKLKALLLPSTLDMSFGGKQFNVDTKVSRCQ